MEQLTDAERRMLALGLCLASDYLKLEAKNRAEVTTTQFTLASKLGVETEHSKAMAETAELGYLFRRARQCLEESR